jgi:Transposase and inactivated derivatives
MPRPTRDLPDNVPQHIVNRGNRKALIFRQPEDYFGFIGAMAEAAEHTVVRVIAFCLMPNHFHLVLWPVTGPEISRYMQLLMNTHLRDLMNRHGTAGKGHVYQGRYRNHMARNETHFLNMCRYVEANAKRARLVERAEDWPWSSLVRCGPEPDINLLSPWPSVKPRDWMDQVNAYPISASGPTVWQAHSEASSRVSPSVAAAVNLR